MKVKRKAFRKREIIEQRVPGGSLTARMSLPLGERYEQSWLLPRILMRCDEVFLPRDNILSFA